MTRWHIAAKVFVSATLIAWLLSRTPVSSVAATLSRLDLAATCAALALTLAAWWISALRLWLLVPEYRLRDITRMTLVGLYFGTVLPGQVAGDVVKAYRLSHYQSSPGRAAAATFVDRVVATLALFVLGSGAAQWVPEAPRQLALALVLTTVALLAALPILLHARPRAWLLGWFSQGPRDGLRALPGRFALGLDIVMQYPVRLFANLAVALLFHALCVSIHIAVGASLSIALPIAAWCLVYAGVSLLTLLPISIAGLGLREGGYVGLLALFGVAAAQALSLSLVLFAFVLLGALLGLFADLAGRRFDSVVSKQG